MMDIHKHLFKLRTHTFWVFPLLLLGCSAPQPITQLGVPWSASTQQATQQLQSLGLKVVPVNIAAFVPGAKQTAFQGKLSGWEVTTALTFTPNNHMLQMVTDHTFPAPHGHQNLITRLRKKCTITRQDITERLGSLDTGVADGEINRRLNEGPQKEADWILYEYNSWSGKRFNTQLYCLITSYKGKWTTLKVSVISRDVNLPWKFLWAPTP
ncbi:hypothetical protein [Deinococcus misasensis]|uniref:hypothetical protein n=1 Tax=Deinococcus misasensis TaxID=392413 RepID=UPI000555CB56|nr:hypothetical protein [Deinococcus misasensis]